MLLWFSCLFLADLCINFSCTRSLNSISWSKACKQLFFVLPVVNFSRHCSGKSVINSFFFISYLFLCCNFFSLSFSCWFFRSLSRSCFFYRCSLCFNWSCFCYRCSLCFNWSSFFYRFRSFWTFIFSFCSFFILFLTLIETIKSFSKSFILTLRHCHEVNERIKLVIALPCSSLRSKIFVISIKKN